MSLRPSLEGELLCETAHPDTTSGSNAVQIVGAVNQFDQTFPIQPV